MGNVTSVKLCDDYLPMQNVTGVAKPLFLQAPEILGPGMWATLWASSRGQGWLEAPAHLLTAPNVARGQEVAYRTGRAGAPAGTHCENKAVTKGTACLPPLACFRRPKDAEGTAMEMQEIFISPGDRFIRIRDVIALTGLSRSQVYKLASDGAFPLPVKLSDRCVAWLHSEVDRWMQARIRGRAELAKAVAQQVTA